MPSMSQRIKDIIGDSFGAAIVEQTLEKAIRDAKESAAEPTTTFYDPMSLFMGRDWLTKGNGSISPTDLRAMSTNPIIGSIVQTRINQIASFCNPRMTAYDVGYEIKTDDPEAQKDSARIQALKAWVYSTGITGYGEASLEVFARKFMRDSLVLDQACAEVVNRRNTQPAYVVAVDSATIKKLRASLDYATPPNSTEPLYAQVIGDVITTQYSYNQMMFGVRNPQTDIELAGYGMSELELLIRTVTAILNTEKFNNSHLMQGGTAKGILVVKGDLDPDQFNIFKRDFREAVRNAAQYWRPPVLQVSKDANIDWHQLDRSNRDMEYSQLFDFLVKQACGVYQIDPAEINWQIGATGAKVNYESSQNVRFKASHQKGLAPLLGFLANQINHCLLQRIDPRYKLEFTGLDQDRAADAMVREREVKTTTTVNEQRAELGKPPIPGGDIILDMNYMRARFGTKNDANIDLGSPGADPSLNDGDPKDRDVDINYELDQD